MLYTFLSRCMIALVTWLVLSQAVAQAEIKIIVNAHRGTAEVSERWGELSKYLSAEMGDTVTLVPTKVPDVVAQTQKQQDHFVLSSIVHTAQLQQRYGTIPLSTANTKTGTQYAGLILTKKGSGLREAQDLKGKKVVGLAKTASSGYIFQAYHLLQKGIDIHKDCQFQQVLKQEDIILMVRSGAADAGFVRAGVLEDMAAAGKINLDEYDAVDRRSDAKYPFLHSTAMYADWYMSALPHVDPSIVQRFKKALLQLPATHEAARVAEITGFVEPLPLDPINAALQALRIGVSENTNAVTADPRR